MATTEKSILLDADVLIHLTKGGRLNLLHDLYPKRLLILDAVLHELRVYDAAETQVQNMIRFKRIIQYEIPVHISGIVLTEYARIRKKDINIGLGEAYCMAVAKHDDKIIASSNLRDIKEYCQSNKIEFITTMDIIADAYERKIMTEADCDFFIYNITSKGSRLPFSTIKAFLSMK